MHRLTIHYYISMEITLMLMQQLFAFHWPIIKQLVYLKANYFCFVGLLFSFCMGSTTIRLWTFRLRHFVYKHFVYRHFVYYCIPGYIELLFQQIIIFVNSNFYLHFDSLYQSNFHWHYDNTTYIVSKHCGMKIQLVFFS